MSSDIVLRDNKGRLISKGTHKNINKRASVSSQEEMIPMTCFKWEIPPAMVVSIP